MLFSKVEKQFIIIKTVITATFSLDNDDTNVPKPTFKCPYSCILRLYVMFTDHHSLFNAIALLASGTSSFVMLLTVKYCVSKVCN